MIKETPQYARLIEALNAIKDLEVPEILSPVALEYLLAISSGNTNNKQTELTTLAAPSGLGSTGDLRSLIAKMKLSGAVKEIPFLMYWAKTYEGQTSLDEKAVIELYRRAGIRPPRNVTQSFRDLCSKKYGRLETAEQAGYVRLSRVGEDFVLHDLIAKTNSKD